MKFFLKRMNNKKGFTLIELIVVIAILAILALIAIPRFSGFTDKARKAADEELAETVATATLLMYTDGGAFSGSTTDEKITELITEDLLATGTSDSDLQYYVSMTIAFTDGEAIVTLTDSDSNTYVARK